MADDGISEISANQNPDEISQDIDRQLNEVEDNSFELAEAPSDVQPGDENVSQNEEEEYEEEYVEEEEEIEEYVEEDVYEGTSDEETAEQIHSDADESELVELAERRRALVEDNAAKERKLVELTEKAKSGRKLSEEEQETSKNETNEGVTLEDNNMDGMERTISPIHWDNDSNAHSISDHEERAEEEVVSKEEYHRKLKSLFKDAAFFMIKSANHENVSLAKAKGVWSTPTYNQVRIDRAFKECRNVLLIFSVKESGSFQGFARVKAPSTTDHPIIRWVLPPSMHPRKLSRVIKLDWISRRDLPFDKAAHLHNQWNDNKPVKIGMDGQDIEPQCAETLCQLFPIDDKIDIDEIVDRSRRTKDERQQHQQQQQHHKQKESSPTSALSASAATAAAQSSSRRADSDDESSGRKRKRDYPDDGPRKSRRDNAPRREPYRDLRDGPRRPDPRRDHYNHHRGGYDRGSSGGYYRSRDRGSPPRRDSDKRSYSDIQRDVLLNGTYEDYMDRYYRNQGGRQPPGLSLYPPPPPLYSGYPHPLPPYPPSYYPPDSRRAPDYGAHMPPVPRDAYLPSSSSSSRPRSPGQYEREVAEFLRRTSGGGSSDRLKSPQRRERSRSPPPDSKDQKKTHRSRSPPPERVRHRSKEHRHR